MEMETTITPTVNQQGVIMLSLTADQYDEINRALVSYNKRREINRNQAAKRRGTSDPRACKPTLILGYPVAETPLQIPNRTTINTRSSPPPPKIVPVLPPLPIIVPVSPSSLDLERLVMG